MGENHDAIPAALDFLGPKVPAESRPDPQGSRQSRRDTQCDNQFRLALNRHRHALTAIGRQALELLGFRRPIQVVQGRGGEWRASLLLKVVDAHQPVRVRERQRVQNHPLENNEHGGIRANGQRKQRNRRQRERLVAPHAAQRVAPVRNQSFEPSERPHVANALLDLRGVSERRRIGVMGTHGAMKRDLVFQVPIQASSLSQSEPPPHAVSITCAIAAARRTQLLASIVSLLRPAGVRR